MKKSFGFILGSVRGFAIYLVKMVSFIFLLALAAVIYQYITCPVYRFPAPEPFRGDKIFNPYEGADSNHWRKANFQVQSYAWGGMTDGRKNSNETIDSVYRSLGYDIIATSDYQRINSWGNEKESFIPVYEHGYGLFKNHQVMVGPERVHWVDFPLFQNLHHKQHILNILRKNNALTYIAHPGLRGGYKPEDMKYLTGYQGLEVLNYAIVSEAHWDSALSAGRYVTIMGNDDSHDVSQHLEVGHRCTYIHSASLHGDSIMEALRLGKAYGADIYRPSHETMQEKIERAKKIARLESVTVKGDTLNVKVSREVKQFRFIGQGGKVRRVSWGADSAVYVFDPEDTFIRTEILFTDRNTFYLNPIIRYDGQFPTNPPLAEVDMARSWIFWIISWSTLFFILFHIFYLPRRWKKRGWTLKAYFAGNPYRLYLFWLVVLSLVTRGILAALLELGNDEVYYRTYALFPDLGHFDHPPMVGWVIQFFTFDLLFQSEFFLRLPGLILGSASILLVYMIGKELRDPRTGWYAALLFTASLYCFILSGTFILPDTPQLFFWLLALYLFLKPLTGEPEVGENRWRIMLAGAVTGLALLSKYTSIFLWVGSVLFIILYNRKWLRSLWLYLSILVSILMFLPVIIWNSRNDFISFTFHGSRAGLFHGGPRLDFFFIELLGEIFYNNPVVYFGIVLAVVAFFKGRKLLRDRRVEKLLLLWSLPLITVFLLISLFRQTLPHWTGPAYTVMIFLAAGNIREVQAKRKINRLIPPLPATGIILLLLVVVLGVLQINRGILYTGQEEEMTRRGRNDVSMDMYGWEQVRKQFSWLANEDLTLGVMPEGAPIVSFRWFPAANLDYYVARHTHREVLAYGPLENIHKYHWINEERGGFREGMDAYYITTSRNYRDPAEVFGDIFREIDGPYYFPIERGGKVAGYGFIYRLKDMR